MFIRDLIVTDGNPYCNTNYLIGAIRAMFHAKKTCGLVTLKWR